MNTYREFLHTFISVSVTVAMAGLAIVAFLLPCFI